MFGFLKKKESKKQPQFKGKRRKWERFEEKKSNTKPSKSFGLKQKSKQKAPGRKVVSRTSEKEKVSFINRIFDLRFGHNNKIFYSLISLMFLGLIFIFSASIVPSFNINEGDKFYFIQRHITFLIIGSVFLLLFYFVRIELISKLWFIPLGVSVGLLLFLFVMGFIGQNTSVNGANRWLSLGGSSFQPSEFAKLSFVIFVSAFLSTRKTHYKDFKEYLFQNLMPYMFWFLLILGLIVAGKNLSTAIIIGFVGIALYGISAISSYQKRVFVGLVVFGVLSTITLTFAEGYRAERLKVFTNYWKTGDTYVIDDEGRITMPESARHFNIAISSTGSGGVWGVGLGRSLGKYHLFHTSAGDDLIISVIAEELGFILTSLLILLYFYLVYQCLTLASRLVDKPAHFYLLVGCALWIGFQAFTHIAANFGVVPLTGQTLPFISLGGSSLISLMCASGIILNVSKGVGQESEKKRGQRRVLS